MKQIAFGFYITSILLLLASGTHAQDRSSGAKDGQARAEQARERAEEAKDRAKEAKAIGKSSGVDADSNNRSDAQRSEHAPNEHSQNGAEVAADKQQRRDEAKAIKEEYQESREPGLEGADLDGDEDASADEPKKKPKKPWWKFWEE